MADAATMAGMAFANAFLGVCHSMAHKLGAFHHLPHGVANALLIDEVLRFNAADSRPRWAPSRSTSIPIPWSGTARCADFLGGKARPTGEVENSCWRLLTS